MSLIGNNNPPSNIDFASETTEALSAWLTEHPVIQSEDDARAGKLLVDRAKGSLAELEDERDKAVRPLNEQVKTINDQYRPSRESLTKVKDILLDRLEIFTKAERAKREREVEEKRLALEEAERRARESEEREEAAKDDAQHGVEADVAHATLQADRDFEQFERAQRELARAGKATRVKLTGGFARALSLKKTEILSVQDYRQAIQEMGLSGRIIEAILSDAREFRRVTGDLPAGISSEYKETL